jgi:hypothetical protein
MLQFYYRFSHSSNQTVAIASAGILQSPLAEMEMLLTFGPSGAAERLNC